MNLTPVVVSGFGQEPLLLLSNVEVTAPRKPVWRVVQGSLSRWLVEETIRYIKQSYQLEDLRVLPYERRRNLAALGLASAYFAAAGLASRVMKKARRVFGVPEFDYYALAEGIGFVRSRRRPTGPKSPYPTCALNSGSFASPRLLKTGESPNRTTT